MESRSSRGRGYGRAPRGNGNGNGNGQQQRGPGQQPRGPGHQSRGPGQQQQQGAQQQQQQQQQRAGPGGPPPQSAWGRPSTSAGGAWPQPPSKQKGFGRGEEAEGTSAPMQPLQQPMETVEGSGDGSTSQASSSGLGAGRPTSSVRGRQVTVRNEVVYTRPSNCSTKTGSTGRKRTLTTNHVALLTKPEWCLYQYQVDFAPEIDVTSKKKFLLKNAIKDTIRNGGYLFDGCILYTPNRLKPDTLELIAVDESNTNIRITIRLVGDVTKNDYHYHTLFNIIMKKCLQLMGLRLINRSYFDPQTRIDLREHNLQIWPGYFTSIRQHEKQILLNIDLSFKVMRMDTVYDMMMEIRQYGGERSDRGDRGDRSGAGRGDFKKEVGLRIIGQTVLTSYNNALFRVDDIDYSTSPRDTFPMADGSRKSYLDYYREKYGITIRDENQPLLISKAKARQIRAGMSEIVKLIPELCFMTGLTDRQRSNMRLMQAMANHTRVAVNTRVEKLLQFVTNAIRRPEVMDELRRWNMQLSDKLLELPGRIIPKEKIMFGQGRDQQLDEKVSWQNAFRNTQMFINGTINGKMAVMYPRELRNPTKNMIDSIIRASSGMRWTLPAPTMIELDNDRLQTYTSMIETTANSDKTIVLYIVILKNDSLERYAAIKKKLCCDLGFPSQVILAKSLNNKNVMSIATKISIQLNCKVGGAPWTVNIPLKGLMVIGYDVCRDSTSKKKSFAGIVASLDRQLTRYYSVTKEHENEEELSSNFSAAILVALKRYLTVNKSFPTSILILRDGVGDGQVKYVFEQELQTIRNALIEKIYGSQENLKLAFVIVSKRINTKFFVESRFNPESGTVIDDVVTLPNRYDFFLISTCCNQGTVTPTSYNVIYDSLNLGADKLQMLIYKLTHMYFNWSGTIRVPAPCQYAHKLAFLTSQCLHRSANTQLDDTLFYL